MNIGSCLVFSLSHFALFCSILYCTPLQCLPFGGELFFFCCRCFSCFFCFIVLRYLRFIFLLFLCFSVFIASLIVDVRPVNNPGPFNCSGFFFCLIQNCTLLITYLMKPLVFGTIHIVVIVQFIFYLIFLLICLLFEVFSATPPCCPRRIVCPTNQTAGPPTLLLPPRAGRNRD